RADSPPPEVLCQLARDWRMAAVVLDTFLKDGTTLLDWLPVPRIAMLCGLYRAAGVRVALAGSLGVSQIAELRHARPDWFAVRGAACRGGREGEIDADRVRELKEVIGTWRTGSTSDQGALRAAPAGKTGCV